MRCRSTETHFSYFFDRMNRLENGKLQKNNWKQNEKKGFKENKLPTLKFLIVARRKLITLHYMLMSYEDGSTK